ncbi:MAG: N-acetylglucosamine-6-phosphate deacetylase [Clostridia bacterium]|nr:N-acetylglucosamine-6-phosphate deacetylase [Clostridia bacterium]
MIIRNGAVLRDGVFTQTDIRITGGRIGGFGSFPDDSDVYDAAGLYVLPGLIDTHIHGSVGVEFASPDEDFEKARVWLARQGVTGFAATVRALPADRTIAAERNILRESRKPSKGAHLFGIHLEGPFVSPKKSGVMHPPEETCAVETFSRFVEAGEGLLKIMTIAPERENALAVIVAAKAAGVHASLGHTDATYAQAEAAIDAGASRATHVFNAMRPFCHRETGVLGAVLTDERVNTEMICDLVHNDPPTVRMVYRLKGAHGMTLVSDSGVMSGLGDGEYVVDGHTRIVSGGVCRSPEGRIAGSTVSMAAGAKTLAALGVPLADIAVMGAKTPAKVLGIDHITGAIQEGLLADLIVVDAAFDVKAVFVEGKHL